MERINKRRFYELFIKNNLHRLSEESLGKIVLEIEEEVDAAISRELENTELIVCPNCGEEVDDSHDLFNGDKTEITLSCLECGQRIKAKVEKTTTRRYTSCKTDEI